MADTGWRVGDGCDDAGDGSGVPGGADGCAADKALARADTHGGRLFALALRFTAGNRGESGDVNSRIGTPG